MFLTEKKASKPLNRKIYGSIPHLPESKLGPSDRQANPGHVRIATEKLRDRHDIVFVTEKLDGSNCGFAKLKNGEILALTRAGYMATSSPFEQHLLWDKWVRENDARCSELLKPGEWAVGEWCAAAHGTLYSFMHEPFFLFDIFSCGKRLCHDERMERNFSLPEAFRVPWLYRVNGPVSLDDMLEHFNANPLGMHGAIESIEGYVWRVERKSTVDFLIKYVRPDKEVGKYLSDDKTVWNRWPESQRWIS